VTVGIELVGGPAIPETTYARSGDVHIAWGIVDASANVSSARLWASTDSAANVYSGDAALRRDRAVHLVTGYLAPCIHLDGRRRAVPITGDTVTADDDV
jgi:hypothetical protein